MPAHSSVVTNLPGADLNSTAGPKGGGQDARNKVRQDTPYRRLATNGGEKCGLAETLLELGYFGFEFTQTLFQLRQTRAR